MIRQKRTRVLIVDDSMFFREFLSKGISADPEIEIVAKAVDPFDARDKILEYEPDVMTCDIEMPKMNGIEFIKRLLPQYRLPIVVVSAVSDAVFNAMNAGAVDFVVKPDKRYGITTEAFIGELIEKIKIASTANMSCYNPISGFLRAEDKTGAGKGARVIAIGASTGGTEAIYNVLKDLPSDMPGIVIVQHIPPVFSKMFAERLNDSTRLRVKEAQQGDLVERGKVLIAPGDAHMRLKKTGNKLSVEVFKGEKKNGHCPSVDILFESVAKVIGANAVGVILTGMGADGAKGLLAMRERGAKTIGQNEKTAVVYGMPKVAYDIGAVMRQLPLNDIPLALLKK